MNDSFVFYRSFYDALREFKQSDRTKIYDAIFQYIFDGKEPELRGTSKAAWILIRPQLDANIRRRENGNKGGRPAKTKPTVSEKETNGYSNEKPMVIETASKTETETKPNVNVNVNANANVNVKERNTKEKKHRFGIYNNVLLTDEELGKLKTEFPDDWQKRINDLSAGIEIHGYKYKSHIAAIRKWAQRDAERATVKKTKEPQFIQGTLEDDLDEIEKLTRRRAT